MLPGHLVNLFRCSRQAKLREVYPGFASQVPPLLVLELMYSRYALLVLVLFNTLFSPLLLLVFSQELKFRPRKVEAIRAQAKRLTDIAATSGVPLEVNQEKLTAVEAEVMAVHDRRQHRLAL